MQHFFHSDPTPLENITGQLTPVDLLYPLIVFGFAFLLSISLAFGSWV